MPVLPVTIDFDPEVVIRTKFRAYLDAAEQAGEDAKAQAEQFVADMKEKAGVYIQGQIDEAQKCLDQINDGYENVKAACTSLVGMAGNATATSLSTAPFATVTTPVPLDKVALSILTTTTTFATGLSGQISNLKAAVGSMTLPLTRLDSLFMGFGAGLEFPDKVTNPIKAFYDASIVPVSGVVEELNDLIKAINLPGV